MSRGVLYIDPRGTPLCPRCYLAGALSCGHWYCVRCNVRLDPVPYGPGNLTVAAVDIEAGTITLSRADDDSEATDSGGTPLALG